MGLFDALFRKNERQFVATDGDEFCPRCNANLTLQKGYCNDLPYWNCLSCGEMLINPQVETDSDIVWICDKCKSMLNGQPGFTEDCGTWKCVECGQVNKIDDSEIYLSEEEYVASLDNPYHGMTDEDVIVLMGYEELACIKKREDILVIKDEEDRLYVKKILDIYDESIYRYLMEHPVVNMPRIISVHRGTKKLIVVEEYIDGVTLSDLLDKGTIKQDKAVRLVRDVCVVLRNLHTLEHPIIHRDVKPSNVLLDSNSNVYLLDVNVAKWYRSEEIEDTKMLGTKYFAAPEQLGYGFSASTSKSDIYALGMLLNMLVVGKLPKEEKATGSLWPIIEKCIHLIPEERYTDDELIEVLNKYLEEYHEEDAN